MIVFNSLGLVILLIGFGVGWAAEAIGKSIWSESVLVHRHLFFISGGVVVVCLDLLMRWRHSPDAKLGRFLYPSTGGQLMFVPLWILSGLAIAAAIRGYQNPRPPRNTIAPATVTEALSKNCVSKEGRFKASFPGDPQQSVSGETTCILYADRTKKVIYAVRYTDEARLDGTRLCEAPVVEALLNSLRDAAIKDYKGTLRTENPVTLRDFPGREFIFKGHDQSREVESRQRIYLAPGRIYQVFVVALGHALDRDDARRFFTSFDILDEPPEDTKGQEDAKSQE
jgi:hypothetical protein